MIIHIVRKDWRLLWPVVLLVTAFQLLLGWMSIRWGYFGEDLVARTLLPVLSSAWYLGIAALVVAAVHQDPIPGVTQDWLVRPVRRLDLLCAKVLFVTATISIPMLVVDLFNARAAGFTLAQAFAPMAVKEIYVLLTLIVPLLALASVTENWPQIVIGAAILMVLFALCLIAASFAIGADRCPTCGTGLRWIQSLLEHGAVLLGAAFILVLQYLHRRTSWSRWLIAAGVMSFALVQLPWNIAFAIQQLFSRAPGDAAPVTMTFDAAAQKTANSPNRRTPTVGAGAAAHALLRGNTDDVAEYLRRRALPDSLPVTFAVPLRIMGMPNRTLLQVDRSEIRLFAADGRLLYHSASGGELAGLDLASGSGPSYQTIELPARLYRQWAKQPVRLEFTYSLALLRFSANYSMPATAGELRSREFGRCASQLSRDLTEINLRCRQVGLGPVCYTVTLAGTSGMRNPEIASCTPDYRPFAALGSAALTFFGIDVPVRDHAGLMKYPVASSEIPAAKLLVTTYSVRDHFTRNLTTPDLLLESLHAQLR